MDFGGFSGGLRPSSVSRQISGNLDSFSRNLRRSGGAVDPRDAENPDIRERSLRAGRIYREVAEKVAAEMDGLTPEQLLDLGDFLEDFQQDLKAMVQQVRERLATRQQALASRQDLQEARKTEERRERLDSSYDRMKDFLSTETRAPSAPAAPLAKPTVAALAGRFASEGTAGLNRLWQGLEGDPAERKTFFEGLNRDLRTPEGARAFQGLLAQTAASPEAGQTLLRGLSSGLDLREGRQAFAQVLEATRTSPRHQAGALQALAEASSTPSGRADLAHLLREPETGKALLNTLAAAVQTQEGRAGVTRLIQEASGDPATARAFLDNLGKATRTPEGLQNLGTLLDSSQGAEGFWKLAASATRSHQGQVLFETMLQDLTRATTPAHPLAGSLTGSLRTPEGAGAFLEVAANLRGHAEQQRNLLAFLLPTGGQGARPEGPEPMGRILAQASRTRTGSEGLLELLAGTARAENGRQTMADMLGWLRSHSEARHDFVQAMTLAVQGDQGARSLQELTREMNRTPESRDAVLRTLAQVTSNETGRTALTGFVEALGKAPATRDAVLGLLESALIGEGQRKTVRILLQNLEKSPPLNDRFLDTVRQAVSTPKGQVEFRNLASLMGLQTAPSVPEQTRVALSASQPVSVPPPTAREAPGTSRVYTDRVLASGLPVENLRELRSGKRRPAEKVEEVKLEAHKRTAFDATDIFPASAFRVHRKCSHCGFESKAGTGSCPHCAGEGRAQAMTLEVRYNLHGALSPPIQDLLEFTPRTFRLLAEGLLGTEKLVFLRYKQVAPRFKELLEVVHVYR